ncbi:MAG: hypothetical protein MUF23_15405 [Pirellula sp.]|jgi:hypothetical protein|nr:hypothetical protein [Pirellula sp.]
MIDSVSCSNSLGVLGAEANRWFVSALKSLDGFFLILGGSILDGSKRIESVDDVHG